MTAAAHPSRLTDQRLARVSLWLALTATWFAAHVLSAVAPKLAAQILARHARDVRLLLVARAVLRLGFKAPQRGLIPTAQRRYTTRRVVGAALRRALRGRTPTDRARALCAVLAEGQDWIARLMRRLRRGLTKLRALPKPRRARLRVLTAGLSSPLCAADTS